ncbi:hypothetical protein [Streptomyces beihaiensis]|uniref:Uncharacterized protein n=1 Tax=Streptomyces beihaiensis TaxID=2984495 RepID=A0ABT3U563_9ACTN|nr:hypothetical protein [Streptomyces beihaiensis]MCX3064215.1 hypothetical protein [Streptomyces beihaiensis]
MDPEVAALATAGATTLVTQMTTDAWIALRGRFARVLSRGRERERDAEEAVSTELDAAREELIAARADGDEATVADVEAEWRSRMRRALAADPALADELRGILDELASSEQQDGPRIVNNVVNNLHGGVHYGTTIQAGIVGSPPRRN